MELESLRCKMASEWSKVKGTFFWYNDRASLQQSRNHGTAVKSLDIILHCIVYCTNTRKQYGLTFNNDVDKSTTFLTLIGHQSCEWQKSGLLIDPTGLVRHVLGCLSHPTSLSIREQVKWAWWTGAGCRCTFGERFPARSSSLPLPSRPRLLLSHCTAIKVILQGLSPPPLWPYLI